MVGARFRSEGLALGELAADRPAAGGAVSPQPYGPWN
jgi:hypothetical protein